MEEKQEKKGGNKLILPLIVTILIIIALFGYICYEKGKAANKTVTTTEETKKEANTKEEVKSEESEEIEECICEKEKPKCYGTYYINGDATQGIYRLNEDGTYKVEGQEDAGVFTIHDNTISFMAMKHTTGPRDVDPIYNTSKNYVISDDCSKIVLASGDTSASLEKQK